MNCTQLSFGTSSGDQIAQEIAVLQQQARSINQKVADFNRDLENLEIQVDIKLRSSVSELRELKCACQYNPFTGDASSLEDWLSYKEE